MALNLKVANNTQKKKKEVSDEFKKTATDKVSEILKLAGLTTNNKPTTPTPASTGESANSVLAAANRSVVPLTQTTPVKKFDSKTAVMPTLTQYDDFVKGISDKSTYKGTYTGQSRDQRTQIHGATSPENKNILSLGTQKQNWDFLTSGYQTGAFDNPTSPFHQMSDPYVKTTMEKAKKDQPAYDQSAWIAKNTDFAKYFTGETDNYSYNKGYLTIRDQLGNYLFKNGYLDNQGLTYDEIDQYEPDEFDLDWLANNIREDRTYRDGSAKGQVEELLKLKQGTKDYNDAWKAVWDTLVGKTNDTGAYQQEAEAVRIYNNEMTDYWQGQFDSNQQYKESMRTAYDETIGAGADPSFQFGLGMSSGSGKKMTAEQKRVYYGANWDKLKDINDPQAKALYRELDPESMRNDWGYNVRKDPFYFMDSEETAILNAYAANGDYDGMMKFYNDHKDSFESRQTEWMNERGAELADKAPVLATVGASVGAYLGDKATDVTNIMANLGMLDAAKDVNFSAYDAANLRQTVVSNASQAVKDKYGEVPAAFIEILDNSLNNGLRFAETMAFGPLVNGTKIGKTAIDMGLMYLQTYGDSFATNFRDTGDWNYSIISANVDAANEFIQEAFEAPVKFSDGMGIAAVYANSVLDNVWQESLGTAADPAFDYVKEALNNRLYGTGEFAADAPMLKEAAMLWKNGTTGNSFEEAQETVKKDYLGSIIKTALISTVMPEVAIAQGGNAITQFKTGKNLMLDADSFNMAVEQGKQSNVADVRQTAEEIDQKRKEGKLKPSEVGRFVNTLATSSAEDSAITRENAIKDILAKELESKMSSGPMQASEMAKAVAKRIVRGENALTRDEKNLIGASPAAMELVNDFPQERNDASKSDYGVITAAKEVLAGVNAQVMAKNLTLDAVLYAADGGTKPISAREAKRQEKLLEKEDKVISEQRIAEFAQKKVKINVDGKETDGQLGKITGVGANATVDVKTTDGASVSAKLNEVIADSSDVGAIYKAAAQMDTVEGANAFINAYNVSKGMNLTNFARGFTAAMDAGMSGTGIEKGRANLVAQMPEMARTIAQSYGQMKAMRINSMLQAPEEVRGSLLKKLSSLPKSGEGVTTGVVLAPAEGTKISTDQAMQIAVMDYYAKRFGKKLTIVSGEDLDAQGMNISANESVISLNSQEDLLTQVGGHEWYHGLVKAAQTDKEMASMLKEYNDIAVKLLNSQEGYDIEARIAEKMNAYRKAGKEISREEAMEELLAQESGAVFSRMMDAENTDIMQQMKNEHPGLLQKIRDFLKNFVNRIKSSLESMGKRDKEINAVMNAQLETAQDLYDRFTAMMERNVAQESVAEVQEAASNKENTVNPVMAAIESNPVLNEKLTKAQNSVKNSFKMDDVVEARDDELIATHAINEFNLLRSLNKGGLLAPSIAISKALQNTNGDFGEISIVFDPKAIDPANNTKTELYNKDVWSPTVTNEVSKGVYGEKVSEKANKAIRDLKKSTDSYTAERVVSLMSGLFTKESEADRENEIRFILDQINDTFGVARDSVIDAIGEITGKKYSFLNPALHDFAESYFPGDVTLSMRDVIREPTAQEIVDRMYEKNHIGRGGTGAVRVDSLSSLNRNSINNYDAFESKFTEEIRDDLNGLPVVMNKMITPELIAHSILFNMNSINSPLHIAKVLSLGTDTLTEKQQSLVIDIYEKLRTYKDADIHEYAELKDYEVSSPASWAAVVVPEDANSSLIYKLNESGVKVITYDGSDEDRIAKLNSQELASVRWSVKEEDGLSEAAHDVGANYDKKAGTAYASQYSLKTWNESDYVVAREQAAAELAKSLGVKKEKASKWIDDVNSVAAKVAADRSRLDYFASPGRTSFKSNPEYGGSIDPNTLCPKRKIQTGTIDAIQRAMPDFVMSKSDLLRIRTMLKEAGHEVSCGLCFVESSRKNLAKYASQFLQEYNAKNNTSYTMVDVNTIGGLEDIRMNHPEVYAAYEAYMNKLNQRKPKLFETRAEYNNDILKHFRSDSTVENKNRNGGMRINSFSDFEAVHLIDMMQVMMDMSNVGLAGQAYTKQADFAKAFGGTGLKINLSLISGGLDENGRIILDDREGMPWAEAEKIRNGDYAENEQQRKNYQDNVGTILVVFTQDELKAALNDDRIDFIIPFHRSQWSKADYAEIGLNRKTFDFTRWQNEKDVTTGKRSERNYMPNEYWDFSMTGKENAEQYLEMCYRDGKIPKFAKLLDRVKMEDGSYKYQLKADGSTDGYWKLLGDFKVYNHVTGEGTPQNAITPDFNMTESMRILKDYEGGADTFPVDQNVVDAFVNEKIGTRKGVSVNNGRISLNNTADVSLSVKDNDYLTAAENGDEETAQQMVDAQAEKSMPDSKIRDEDGNLLKVYHGTDQEFTVFDMDKGRSSMDIQGAFFSPWDIDAEGYGPNVRAFYLDIKNPAPENVGYRILIKYKGQNYAGRKAREELIRMGYDGVNNGDEEYIAFYPEQIKSADPVTYDDDGNVIPLSKRFNTEEQDIRYSVKELQDYSNEEISNIYKEVAGNRDSWNLTPKQTYEFASIFAQEKANKDNFFENSIGYWDRTNKPRREPDYTSYNRYGEVSSQYWYTDKGVYRRSNHWGGEIGHCSWFLNDVATGWKTYSGNTYTGFIEWDDLKPKGSFVSNPNGGDTHLDGFKFYDISKHLYDDARYSKKEETVNPEMARIMEENEQLKNELRNVVEQLNGSGARVDSKDVHTVAKRIRSEYGIKMPMAELEAKMERAMNAIANSRNDAELQTGMEMLTNVTYEALSKAEVTDTTYYDQYKDLRDRLRTGKWVLTDKQWEMAANIYGSEAEFRKAMFGKFNILRKGSEGETLASAWEELSSQYPDMIEAGIKETDMVAAVVNALDRTAKQIQNPYAMDLDQYAADMALKLYQDMAGEIHVNRGMAADLLNAEEANRNLERDLSALMNTQRQMRIDQMEKTERHAAKAMIIRQSSSLLKKLQGTSKTGVIPTEMQEAVTSLMNALDMFGTNHGRITGQMIMDAKQAYESLNRINGNTEDYKDNVNAFYNGDLAEDFDELAKNADGKALQYLDMEDLRRLRRITSGFSAAVNMENQLFADNRRERISEIGNYMFAKAYTRKEHLTRSKAGDMLSSVLEEGLLKPVSVSHMFEGTSLKPLWDNIRKASDKHFRNVDRAEQYLEDSLETYGQQKALDQMSTKKGYVESRVPVTLVTGKVIYLNKQEAMTIYAISKREALIGTQHLTNGGIKLRNIAKGESQSAIRLTGEDVRSIIGILDDNDKKYVDHMVQFITKVGGKWGNEVTQKLYGVDKYTEEYYIPFEVDRNAVVQEPGTEHDKRLVAASHTKAITKGAKSALTITPFTELWCSHVERMSDFNAFTLPIEDFTRVMNYRDGQETMRDAIVYGWGKQTNNYIHRYLSRLNGNSVREPGNALLNSIMSKAKGAAVTFNASVAIQQMGAGVRAMSEISPKYYLPGMVQGAHIKKSYEEMRKYAGVGINKDWGYFDTAMNRGLYQRHQSNLKENLNEWGGKAAEFGDRLNWAQTWEAVKNEQRDLNQKAGKATTGEEFLQQCGERFGEIVDKTQVVDSIQQRAEWATEKGTAAKALNFMSEPLVMYNMLYRDFWDLRDAIQNGTPEERTKAIKHGVRSIAAIILTSALTAGLKSFVSGMRDRGNEKKEKDEEGNTVITGVRTYWDKVSEAFLGNFADNIFGIGTIFTNFINESVSTTGSGDLTLASLQNFVRFMKQVVKIGQVDEEGNPVPIDAYKTAYYGAQTISNITGVGIGGLVRDAYGMVDTVIESVTSGDMGGNAWDSHLPLEKRVSAAEKNYAVKKYDGQGDRKVNSKLWKTLLYEAYVQDGNSFGSNFQMVSDAMIRTGGSADYVASAFKTMYGDNDARVTEAAEAMNSGDFDKASAIMTEMAKNGLGMKAVASMVNTKYNAMQPKESAEAGSTQDALSSLSVEKVSSDPIKAAIKDKVESNGISDTQAISQLVKNGISKDKDEAYWLVKGWQRGDESFSKYTDARNSATKGDRKALNEAVKVMVQHGVDADGIKTEICGKILKKTYLAAGAGSSAETNAWNMADDALRLAGLDEAARSKYLKNWQKEKAKQNK